MFSKYILGGALAISILAGTISYAFYKQNSNLKEEVGLQKVQIENYTDSIDELTKSFADVQKSIIEMNNKTTAIDKVANSAKEALDKTLRTHDLNKIAERKATLFTKIVNRESRKVLDALSELTDPNILPTEKSDTEVEDE